LASVYLSGAWVLSVCRGYTKLMGSNIFSVSKLPVILVVISLFALAFMPSFVHAADTCKVRADISTKEASDLLNRTRANVGSGSELDLDGDDSSDNALLCTYGLIKFATNLLFVAVLAIATFFIALSAFYFITAGQNPDKVQKARNFLIWAVVGLVVASLARVIPAIVRGIIGL